MEVQSIARHNVIHPNISGKPASDKAVSYCTLKIGVTASSIMSNADAEISFIRKVATGYDYDDELRAKLLISARFLVILPSLLDYINDKY